MSKRIAKEYTLETNFPCILKYGTLNKKNPNVIYIRVKGKIIPLEMRTTYSDCFKEIKNNTNKYVDNLVKTTDNILNDYIFDFDTTGQGLHYNKVSNIRYDLMFKPNTIQDISEYEGVAISLGNKIFDNIQTQLSQVSIEFVS